MAALGLSPAYDPDHPVPTRGLNPLDLMFSKGPSIDVSPLVARHGSTSDHLIISTEVTGTSVASLVAPSDPPPMVIWDNLPDVPYSMLPDDEKAKHAELMKDCAEALTSAANASDPLAAMTDGLMAAARKHLGT